MRPSLLLLAVSAMAASPALAQVPDDAPAGVHVGAAVPGVLDEPGQAAGFVEVRWSPAFLSLRPAAGVLAGSQGQLFVFGGVSRDLTLGRVVVTPLFAAGVYEPGGGLDLGNPLEFRSAVEVSWAFDGGVRAGVQLAHTSNAGLGVRNPGHEGIALLLALPFGG